MWQMNNRNRKTGQAIPSQQLMLQRVMPILFAYFYIVIPAAVVLYMIDSTIIRIITQDIMFRTGVSNPHANKERKLPGRNAQAEVEGPKTETPKTPAKPTPPPKKAPDPNRSKSKRQRKDR
jgi:membrane protein insertase Oxa1/YidC/SpoIIIJ